VIVASACKEQTAMPRPVHKSNAYTNIGTTGWEHAACGQTCAHTYTCAHAHTRTHARTHTDAHIDACTHAHARTAQHNAAQHSTAQGRPGNH